MLKFLKIIFLIFVLVSCTTKIIKKDIVTEIRDVEIASDHAGIKDTVDLSDISKEWYIKGYISDSTPVKIEIPKRINLPKKKETIQINKSTSVGLEISTSIDSGQVIHDIEVTKVAYQESTVTETIEIDTSPSYIRWIIIIVIGFLAVLLFTILRK